MSWTRKISHPNEMVEKGQEVECRVLSVDQERRRIALGLKQTDRRSLGDRHPRQVPARARSSRAPVTKITNFGVFVGLENGLEGLLHISELADHKVENPEDVVKVGEVIEVKVLRVDADERKIGLSRKRVEWAEEAERPKPPRRRPRRTAVRGDRRDANSRAAWATAAARCSSTPSEIEQPAE